MEDARFKARSVCKVTSASGIKLHTELTRAFSALVIWGNRILGALPLVRHGESVLWRTKMEERLWR
jgi:hypothetical protein